MIANARSDATDLVEAYALLDDLVRRVPVVLITTVDGSGIMRTRQLPNTNCRCTGDLWFLASRDTPLAIELAERPDVLVTFAERAAGRFVVVKGAAIVRQDPPRVRQLWHPVLRNWIPGGPDDESLVLIQVTVQGVDRWA